MGGEGHVVKKSHEYSPVCNTGAPVSRGRAPGAPRAKLAKAEALSPAGADGPEAQRGICSRQSGVLLSSLRRNCRSSQNQAQTEVSSGFIFHLFVLLLPGKLASVHKAGSCSTDTLLGQAGTTGKAS